MKRKIIHIDESKCDGCGLCVNACHEGALQLVNGKAKLISESYCDGLGDCLPECPQGAITLKERETAAYDEEAVKKHSEAKKAAEPACDCAAAQARTIGHRAGASSAEKADRRASQLGQWPCQIKLVPEDAPYFNGSRLLIAASCTAYAYANLHEDYMKGRVTLIGCPKLDGVDYSEKLAAILRRNDVRSVTVLRMAVPCCAGLVYAVKQAMQESGKLIPWSVAVVSADGEIIEE